MARMLLRPSLLSVIVASIVFGKLVLPHLSAPSASAFVPAPAPNACQEELEDFNQATANLGLMADQLADALTDQMIAEESLIECEMNTPGSCQQEEADVATANDSVDVAFEAYESAEADLQSAQSAYEDCVLNNGPS